MTQLPPIWRCKPAIPVDRLLEDKVELVEKIARREARAGVVGLGYVGLPLALEFAKCGLDVTGIDVDEGKVAAVNQGYSYITDVTSEEIGTQLQRGCFRATSDFSVIRDLDTVNICVPTPLRKTKDPDLSFIIAAVDEIKRYLRRGQLIILESTTYPGTTEEVVKPALEASGLRAGTDFCLAFSPERVDPGNERYKTKDIPRVVGGLTPACAQAARALYGVAIDTVVAVSSTRVAEMVKLLENTFRAVNIGLVNELALMCSKMDIDVWEVIEAASTKPFGFMPFYPGPGLGGHCIPIDPYYLSWKAKMNGFEPRFIELAGQINSAMPKFVVDKVMDALNQHQKSVSGSRVHAIGVAYKPNVNDVRESPALNVLKLLWEKGAHLSYTDPFVPEIRQEGMELVSEPIRKVLERGVDCVVVLTHHTGIDYSAVARWAPLVVDTRNAMQDFIGGNIIRL